MNNEIDDLPDAESTVHCFGKRRLCVTGGRAMERSPLRIILEASDGFVPLWEKNAVLRYRFDQRTLNQSGRSRDEILRLFHKALRQWGDAVPVTFQESTTAWDFEFVVRRNNDCDANGCVLASAFFPGGGQQQLVIYPKMFDFPESEQVETLVHELGHVFGLRHWFAATHEGRWPSVEFGKQYEFTIMNYGEKSVLTEDDRSDLKLLYAQAWAGTLTNIQNTPIEFFKPYSARAPASPISNSANEFKPQRVQTIQCSCPCSLSRDIKAFKPFNVYAFPPPMYNGANTFTTQ
ncbi:hypothetical protein BGZ67_009324 [Mortierella alpina]|nr:hypothetical protein BGZ67_009324 [Mortierella alpina]